MKYNKRDDKARERVTVKNNSINSKIYTQDALQKLASGGYKNRVPELKKTPNPITQNKEVTQTTVSQNKVPQAQATPKQEVTQQKPSTRYNQNVKVQEQKSTRDTKYDNDFNEFHKYRVGDKIGVMDYDANSDREVEHWRNLKTEIMNKNKWSEKEFDTKWNEYYKERSQKEADKEVKNAVEFAKEHPVAATGLQYAYSIPSAIEGGAGMLRGALSYLPFVSNEFKDKYFSKSADDTTFTNTRAQEGMKQAVKEKMSTPGQWVYDITTGVPEMASPLIQAGKSAAQGEMNALERDVDSSDAARTGLASGAIAYGLSKVGLDKAIGSDTLKQAMLSEGGEEVLEYGLNLLADKFINKDKSQINAVHDYYKSQGMSDGEATLKTIVDLGGEGALSGIIGALAGGTIHSVGNLPSLTNSIKNLGNKLDIDNRGAVDPKALAEEARLNVKAPAKVEGAKNANVKLEGAELEQAKLDRKDVKTRRQQIKSELDVLNGIEKKTKADNAKIKALETEDAELAQRYTELGRSINGKSTPIDEYLKKNNEDVYNTIYDRRNGIISNINYAVKMAGDSPEAKQLGSDIRKAYNSFLRTGDANELWAVTDQVNRLDEIGKSVNAEYAGSNYVTQFSDYDPENPNVTLFNKLINKDVNDTLRDIYGASETRKVKPVEVDPNNVIYHAGTLSRLNKADSAGKMEGMRDTGYYGTGHYFVDQAHKSSIGKDSSYGNKPYSSVDISKYNNLYKADTDAKANNLHDFSQKMMRYVNGYNDRYYSSDGEINPLARDNYITDLYGQYLELFPDNHMKLGEFENRLNDMRNNYEYDYYDRGDSAFTIFMKEHGYNGVDTRGTNSANTERGIVIYDLDEDSVLQSNVTDADVKNGLMNTRVRNENPVFDTATDERIQGEIDSYNSRKKIADEYRKLFNDKAHKKLWNDITETQQRISDLENEGVSHYKSIIEDDAYLDKAAKLRQKEFARMGLDEDLEVLKEDMRKYAKENLNETVATVEQEKARLAEMQQKYDADEELSKQAYKQARENVEGTGDRALTPDEVQKLEEGLAESERQAKEGLPREYELATRYAQAYRDFDTYDYDDTTFQGDDGIEKMADDIAKGRDLSQYIEALDNMIEEAPDAETEANMQALRDELSALNEGRVNKVPEVTPTKPTVTPEMPKVEEPKAEESIFNRMMNTVPPDEPPRSDKMGKSKVGTNTMVNSNVYTKKQIDSHPVISELNKYAKANNDLTFNQAKENIYSDGARLLDEYTSGKRNINSDLDVDQAMILLTDMAYKIKAGDEGLEAQRNLLFSRLREAGTLYGQTIQAFKKWNNTPEGAIINGEKILHEPVQRWKSNNKKKTEINSRIAKALEQMGMDSSMRNKTTAEKTHDQVVEGVRNVLEREYGSIDAYFNDNDIEVLANWAENNVPVWQITDEIEHKLSTGEWYTLDESMQPKYPINQKLKNALDSLVAQKPTVKEPPTLDEIRNEVRTTLDKEMARADYNDNDVDYLASIIYNGATKQELAEALNTKMATGKFGISPETQQQVNDLFAYADRFDPDSKQAFDLKTAAYKLIAEEAVSEDATPFEKFESWRYLAMLGNPKTMVRNWVGNKMFGAVTGVSNNLSAALEAGTDRLSKALGGEGIQRTKTFLNPVEDRALIKAAGEDGEAHRYSEISGSKYEKGTKDAIKQQKSVFNSKLLRLYEAATDRGISDTSAVKKKYSTSLAGYMKANGLDESAFDADDRYRELQYMSRSRLLNDAERAELDSLRSTHDLLEKARDYAVKQADYATFHEDNVFAKWLTKASNSAPGPLRMVMEGLVPFKKTPSNILRSGFEYSPLGAIKSIAETRKLIYENTGSRKGNLEDTYIKKSKITGKEKEVSKSLAADVLDSWSKTLTGTALVGLGYYLKNKGIINSSNKDEKWQDDLEGIQNYSITINGKTYTLDWAAPAVMPLLMGAEISKVKDRNAITDKKMYENFDEVLGTANALLDPIFETSMLQGIKNTFETAANDIKYNEDGALGGILGSMAFNTGLGYLTQGVPTVAGQIGRTVDPTRRSTDTLTDQSFLGSIEKQGRKLMNKIPGLSYLNQPYYDSYGRTQGNSPWNDPIRGLLYQTLSPGYLRDINTTAADESARNAYYALGEPNEEGKQLPIMNKDVFPTWKSKVTVGDHKFTPEEMASYRKTSGEAQYAIRDALAKEDWFNNLDGPEQTELLKKINTLVDKIGKDSVDQLDSSSKDYEAYEAGGVPGLINKWKADEGSSRAKEETGLSGSTNAIKEINQAYADGDTKKAEELTEKYKKYNQERERLNEKYGVNIKMSDFTEREDANPGSNETWAKEHSTGTSTTTKTTTTKTSSKVPQVTTGNTTVDTKAHQKYIDRAGRQAKKYTNDIPKLDELNFGSSEKYTYAYAINQDSSLTPQKFDTQFKKMDSDKNGSLKQDELITYFNNNNSSQKDATYLWRTYGENKGAGWKTVPVLKNGTWKKSK